MTFKIKLLVGVVLLALASFMPFFAVWTSTGVAAMPLLVAPIVVFGAVGVIALVRLAVVNLDSSSPRR